MNGCTCDEYTTCARCENRIAAAEDLYSGEPFDELFDTCRI